MMIRSAVRITMREIHMHFLHKTSLLNSLCLIYKRIILYLRMVSMGASRADEPHRVINTPLLEWWVDRKIRDVIVSCPQVMVDYGTYNSRCININKGVIISPKIYIN